jgi:hypothetical protein
MSLIEQVRAKLDAKCSTWGCPVGKSLYDDLHPCTEALCRFRDYFTTGATDEQWQALSDEVDAIHATNWPKMLAGALLARIPSIPCAGVFYYRGGIHTREKVTRLIEKIKTELDRAVEADPTTARNYFVRAEALILELESISRGDITVSLAALIIMLTLFLIIYFLHPMIFGDKKIGAIIAPR